MAVVSVSFDGTRVNDAELTTNWTSATQETEFVYQGTYSNSVQVKQTEAGEYYYNAGTSHDYSTNPSKVWIAKAWITNYGALDGSGLVLEIGTGARSAYYRYFIYTAATYPITGGWLLIPIDPSLAGYRDATTGSPTLSTINFYGIRADFSTTSRTQNVAMDAIDFVSTGTGLTLVGGDGGDTDGTFLSFVSSDEGTNTNRWGIVSTKEGILYVLGVLTIGTATATGFTDSNRTLVFPNGRFTTGFQGVDINLSHASTIVSFSACSFIGRGSRGYADFDSTGDINGTTEIITANQPHNFSTGDAATYSKNGGTASTGLTDATVYYINAISTTTLYVYNTKANAEAGTATGRQNLTAAGAETHSLTRTTDTRPDLGITGTSGTATIDACNFIAFNTVTLTSAVTLTDSSFNDCQALTQSSADIDNCTFENSPVAKGVAFLTSNDPALISNCTFAQGSFGHAIELAAATAGNSYDVSGNIFTGYGPTVFGFHTTNDVNATTDVVTEVAHGYTTGNAIRYMKQGGTAAIGLTDNTTYYVRAVTVDTIAFYASENNALTDTSRIALTATGTETHYINSLDAAIYNNSGGAVTLNILDNGTVPSIRNGSGSSTTVNNNITLTITVQDSSANPIIGAQVAVFKTSDDSVLVASTATNASGVVTQSVAASTGAIYIRVRQSTNTATFATTSGVNGSTEVITTDVAHSFVDGEAVVYSKNGGTAAIGLTAGTTYYVNAITTTTLSLHTSAANAISDTSRVDLTAAGAETHHLDPVRYYPNSTVGTIGTDDFAVTITMTVDSTVTG